jgi:amidase
MWMMRTLVPFVLALLCWLLPVSAVPAFPHTPTGNIIGQFRASLAVDGRPTPYDTATAAWARPFNLTGSPVAVLPVAQSKEGLPIGIQHVGRRWGDMALLAVAEALTEVTGPCRRPPGY